MNFMKVVIRPPACACLLTGVLLAGALLRAQTNTGRILRSVFDQTTAVVKDSDGAARAGVRVEAT